MSPDSNKDSHDAILTETVAKCRNRAHYLAQSYINLLFVKFSYHVSFWKVLRCLFLHLHSKSKAIKL